MFEVRNVSKYYRNHQRERFAAVQNVSFTLMPGETLGLIGDSGSGKSTIGQIVSGLLRPSEGELFFQGKPLRYPVERSIRRQIQILFQHPEVSFNPCLRIFDSIKEPYRLYRPEATHSTIIEDIEALGLREEHLKRYPRELSGGELQRLALARILSVRPSLIVLDEPTGMLDMVSQAQIIHLLQRYQQEHGCAYLFITHHPLLTEYLSHRILYISNGRLSDRPFDGSETEMQAISKDS